MSHREKAGLRGLVRTCVEEKTGPPDDNKYWTTTEYNQDGRLLTTRNTNSDGSGWFTTQTYDADSRLEKTVSGKIGEPGNEVLYAYDESGRLLSITNQSDKGIRTDFRHDEQRGKTSIQLFDPESLKRAQRTSYSGSLWDASIAAGVGVPIGGNIATIYNEKDLPTEAQLRDAQGRIVTRIVRNYDANGQIIEEKQIQENPMLMFANLIGAEGQAQPAQPQPTAVQLEAMNRQMKSMLSGPNGTGISYAYDAQGRVTETRSRNFMFEKVTTTSYNEQGDKSEERETMTQNSSVLAGGGFSIDEDGSVIQTRSTAKPTKLPDALFGETQVCYAYQYDSYGNWTQLTVNRRSKHGEESSTCHRKLTYY